MKRHPTTRQRRLWRSKKRRRIRQSLTRKTTYEVDLEEETDPEETKKLTIKRKTTMKLKKLKYWLTTLKSKSLIDGETHRASVAELKRLYGQEASLTRKSQAVSQQRKQAEDALQRSDALLQAMLGRAEERFKPYSEVDMLTGVQDDGCGGFCCSAQGSSSRIRGCPFPP